jgi:NAD-dependent DNA ligase
VIREIEGKRRLKDYEIFGSIGIKGLSMKTFQAIFKSIPYETFMDLLGKSKLGDLPERLLQIPGVGPETVNLMTDYFEKPDNRKELIKLLKELSVQSTFGAGEGEKLGQVVFTGFRSYGSLQSDLEKRGWEVGESVTKSTKFVIRIDDDYVKGKVEKAIEAGIPVVTAKYVMDNINDFYKEGKR